MFSAHSRARRWEVRASRLHWWEAAQSGINIWPPNQQELVHSGSRQLKNNGTSRKFAIHLEIERFWFERQETLGFRRTKGQSWQGLVRTWHPWGCGTSMDPQAIWQCGWTSQQDFAPAYRANLTLEWGKVHLPGFIISVDWTPYSLGLIQMNYNVWSRLEARACAKPQKRFEMLKQSLQVEWNRIALKELEPIT